PRPSGSLADLRRDRKRLGVILGQGLVVGDEDLVDQLTRAGYQARLQQVRSHPGVERVRVVPLLEEDGLLASIGQEPARELDVDEPGLLAKERELASEDSVERAD